MPNDRSHLSPAAVKREKRLARHLKLLKGISYTAALSAVIKETREIVREQDTNYAHALSLLEAKWNLK